MMRPRSKYRSFKRLAEDLDEVYAELGAELVVWRNNRAEWGDGPQDRAL